MLAGGGAAMPVPHAASPLLAGALSLSGSHLPISHIDGWLLHRAFSTPTLSSEMVPELRESLRFRGVGKRTVVLRPLRSLVPCAI